MSFLFKIILIAGVLSFVIKSSASNILDSVKTRIEIFYDQEEEELQIKVEGKEKIEFVQIYTGEKLLVEFSDEQIPSSDSTIRLKVPCPSPAKFSYMVKTKDGTTHKLKSKKTDLKKNGTFCEIESIKK